MSRIVHSDCLDELRNLPPSSIDLLVTDPPYGYSFMGKDWDKAVPSVDIWKECLRVLKPGAFAFIMSAPRQDVLSQMIVRIGEAGFDTSFTSIYWTYASGFPKAMNIGKMVDKRNGTKRETIKRVRVDGKAPGRVITGFGSGDPRIDSVGNSPLEGSYGGFQPKPAVEVIIVAMKPLSEKTYVDQALKNGKGITWLDDSRIPTAENLNGGAYADDATERYDGKKNWRYERGKAGGFQQPIGRFPANLLVSDDVLNDGVVRKTHAGDWSKKKSGVFGSVGQKVQSDAGSYSRYFDLDAWANTIPFLITPKASKREKGKDCTHPTVKPLQLMSYLITLGSRPGDVVLDPFLGSGTTAIAAKSLGRDYIGIEREEEYVRIARARVDAVTYQPSLLAAE